MSAWRLWRSSVSHGGASDGGVLSRRCCSAVPRRTTSFTGLERKPARRSKRRSYADIDSVMLQHANTPDEATLPESPCGSPAAAHACGVSWPQQRSCAASSLPARLSRAKLLTELTLFRTPLAGQMLARTAVARAHAAYVLGSIPYYTRSYTAGKDPHADASDWSTVSRSPLPPPASAPAAVDWSSKDDAANRAQPSAEGKDVRATPRGAHGSAAGPAFRGFLHGRVLGCVVVGASPIHSRGLFTTADLPAGTRVICEPWRVLLPSPSFVRLLADTHSKLPDTWHYTHPSGSVMELVLQPMPHHLLNHSCEANVCSGLSPVFWPAALAADAGAAVPPWRTRVETWNGFADANSFFVTRDVAAGEELTLDYGTRIAPTFAGEDAVRGRSFTVCRCGRPSCRHFLYQMPPGTHAALRQRTPRGGETISMCSPSPSLSSSACAVRAGVNFGIARELFRLGYDDETVVLSLLPTARPVVSYLSNTLTPDLDGERSGSSSSSSSSSSGSGVAHDADDVRRAAAASCTHMELRRAKKADLLVSYRHIFRLLNEAEPQTCA